MNPTFSTFGMTLALVIATTAPALAEDDPHPLADTRWELVTIREMDDSSHTPDDPSQYTLTLNADGTAGVRSDCNRARGSWTSEQPGQLTFGPMASTMALCGPDSLDEVYRAQFEWVRSYVMRDGHLFLATMADGSIIEFHPVGATVTARLMGEDLTETDPEAVQAAILDRIFGDYAAANGLRATEAEVSTYVETMDRRLKADLGDDYEGTDDLSPEDAAEVKQMRSDMGSSLIERWKINRALYEEYGGRVIGQQLGPEPLDAYRTYLEARQAAGDFEILDDDIREAFWDYFNNEQKHSFLSEEEAAQAFARNPWLDG